MKVDASITDMAATPDQRCITISMSVTLDTKDEAAINASGIQSRVMCYEIGAAIINKIKETHA